MVKLLGQPRVRDKLGLDLKGRKGISLSFRERSSTGNITMVVGRLDGRETTHWCSAAYSPYDLSGAVLLQSPILTVVERARMNGESFVVWQWWEQG